MRNRLPAYLSAVLSICLIAPVAMAQTGSGRVVPASFEVHAKLDKKNVLVHFDQAATAALIDPDALSGVIGVTSDFPGGAIPAYVVFNQSVSDDKLGELSNFQGRLKGSAQCKRVRVGASALYPQLKVAALAEDCTIVSLNH